MQAVGVAMIGCGNFSRHQHLPNLARIPEAELRAVCDTDAAVAEAAGARYAAGYATTDLARVLADDTVEAVVIAVRDHLQADLTMRALQAGKHVYVEKPLCDNPRDCAEVIRVRDAAERRVAVGFNKRFAPIYRLAQRVMAADGGPRTMYARMADDAWRWAKGYPPGYLILHDLCHLFDLMRWFTDAEVTSVYCAASRPDDEVLILRFANGAVATLLQSGHGTMDMPKERFEAICERGGLAAEDYVELRTYGYRDFEARYTFAGHSHPDHEFMHKYLFAHQGLEGMATLRRMTWEMRQRLESDGPAPTKPASGTTAPSSEPAPLDPEADLDADEARQFVEKTIPNFLRDQGWMAAMRAFLRDLRQGTVGNHATVEDALAAARIGAAAVRSREDGGVIALDSVDDGATEQPAPACAPSC